MEKGKTKAKVELALMEMIAGNPMPEQENESGSGESFQPQNLQREPSVPETTTPVPQPAVIRSEIPQEPQAVNYVQPVQVPMPKPVKRRREPHGTDYRSLFLENKPAGLRIQTYIDRGIYDRIKRVLPNLSVDLSITGYINNILAHHLDHYDAQIKEIFYDNTNKAFDNE